jgi:predicted Zn-dependent protease
LLKDFVIGAEHGKPGLDDSKTGTRLSDWLPTPEERIASAEERASQVKAENERLRRELERLRSQSGRKPQE